MRYLGWIGLWLWTALAAGCEPREYQLFWDREPGAGGDMPGPLAEPPSGSGGEPEPAGMGPFGESVTDAGPARVAEGGQPSERTDAGAPRLCPPLGDYSGLYGCDYENGGLVKGRISFALVPDPGDPDIREVENGVIEGWLPVGSDDPTPVLELPELDMDGHVNCLSGNFQATTTPKPLDELPSNLVEVFLSLLAGEPPVAIRAQAFGWYYELGGYREIRGEFRIFGPPDCVGTWSVTP